MRTLSIFISSTCYDLKSLREHLRLAVVSWGHDPILSEYLPFPVSPELSTVDNCRRVVRERADMLVLIIGGKRGSLDPSTLKSVVNSEYQEARTNGLDCMVFIDKQVWDLLPIFRKNKEADFAPTVDNSAVFSFIEGIITDTQWVFPFSKTEEIISTLGAQLSIRMQDLLVRSRQNRLMIPIEFIAEPNNITRIVLEKASNWEYLLTCEILKDRIEKLDAKFADLDSGIVVRRMTYLPARETPKYVQNLLSDLMSVISAIDKVLSSKLTPAFGPVGVQGNANEIKFACDHLHNLFLTFFDLELDIRFVRTHAVFQEIFPRMQGWTTEIRNEFRKIPIEIEKVLSNPSSSGSYTISLVISLPIGFEAFKDDFLKLMKSPNVIDVMATSD